MDVYLEQPHSCAYVKDREVRNLVFTIDTTVDTPPLTEKATAQLLASGFRHFAHSWFIPACDSCDLCRGIVIDVNAFAPSKSQRKLLNKNKHLSFTLGKPSVSTEKINLINTYHKDQEETINWGHQHYTPEIYAASFVDNNPYGYEYLIHDTTTTPPVLIGVGIIDFAYNRASSTYFYYHPSYRKNSLGTWSILKEIALCKEHNITELHLGLHTTQSRSLAYKSRFTPHSFIDKRTVDLSYQIIQIIFDEIEKDTTNPA